MGNRVHVYPYRNVLHEQRTIEQTLGFAANVGNVANRLFHYGVHRVSVLYRLGGGFDYITRCPPDPLHQLDLGLIRAMMHLWFDSANHREVYYIGQPETVTNINTQLSAIKVPHTFKRKCRSLDDLNRFKGHEFRIWLLCYGPVLLKEHLPENVWQHLLLLSAAAFHLSKRQIDAAEILRLKYSLRVFEMFFQDIYGTNNKT